MFLRMESVHVEDPGPPRIIEILKTEKLKEKNALKGTIEGTALYLYYFAEVRLLSVMKQTFLNIQSTYRIAKLYVQ